MILTRHELTLSTDTRPEKSQVDQEPTKSGNPVPEIWKSTNFFESWKIQNFDFPNIASDSSGCMPDVFTLPAASETPPERFCDDLFGSQQHGNNKTDLTASRTASASSSKEF